MAKKKRSKNKPVANQKTTAKNTPLYFYIAGLFALTIIVFIQCFSHEFLLIDDNRHIFENPMVKDPTLSHLTKIWSEPYFLLYIPVVYTVWWLMVAIAGSGPTLEPQLFHAANVILHAVNGLLVAYFAHLVFKKYKVVLVKQEYLPFLIGAFFLWHPLQVESVAWVSALKDQLCFLTSMLFILSFLVPWSKGRRVKADHAFFAFVFLILSMLSKPIALITPMMLFAFSYVIPPPQKDNRWKYSIIGTLICLPFAFMTVGAQDSASSLIYNPIPWRPYIVLDSIGFYISKLFLPIGLAPDYVRSPRAVLEQMNLTFPLLAIVSIGTMAYFSVRKRPYLLALLVAAILPLLPISGLTSFAFQKFSTVADRYFYFSLLPIGIMFGFGLAKLPHPKWVLNGAIGVLLVLGGLSFQQTSHWKNSQLISERILEIGPGSFMGNITIGNYFFSRQQNLKAIEHLKRALLIDDRSPILVSITGTLMVKEKQFQKAVDFLEPYVDNMDHFEYADNRIKENLWLNYGIALYHTGQYSKAKKYIIQSKNTGVANSATKHYLDLLKNK